MPAPTARVTTAPEATPTTHAPERAARAPERAANSAVKAANPSGASEIQKLAASVGMPVAVR